MQRGFLVSCYFRFYRHPKFSFSIIIKILRSSNTTYAVPDGTVLTYNGISTLI